MRNKIAVTFLATLLVFGITACGMTSQEGKQQSAGNPEPTKQGATIQVTTKPESVTPAMSNLNDDSISPVQKKKNEKVQQYKEMNRRAEKGKTVFVGSSLMEQFPIVKFMLKFDKDYRVYNRGISNYVTADLLATMEECVFELEPAKIFINIGTNDIASPQYRQEDLLANYDLILTRVKERLPKSKVFVMAYYPVNAKADFPGIDQTQKEQLFKTRTNQAIQDANRAIEQLAKKHKVEFINVNQGLMDAEGNLKQEYSKDGLHMVEKGYQVVFENLKKHL
ncbi:lysophospholipase [Paenibacillus hemerocallicola]|uniref:Lysophospholipase n=1 Tax=Paenibacillus hemerocallicola TaxID=1172614 RepID=A0A5C4TCC5_9BACL|nr:GDSL-type esterase/lipase family protein [Paenibacillus hemerocallicola]TNJ66119.1 lysophospholipase [Paenibacillus hemerocallicola]